MQLVQAIIIKRSLDKPDYRTLVQFAKTINFHGCSCHHWRGIFGNAAAGRQELLEGDFCGLVRNSSVFEITAPQCGSQ